MWKLDRTIMPIRLAQRGKELSDMMARGIDPITGKMVGKYHLLRNERMSTYFKYISWILGDVIENGGCVYQVERPRDFRVNQSQLEKVPLSETPITIEEFCHMIYGTTQDNKTKQLDTAKAKLWLERQGYLAFDGQSREKYQQIPTQKGREWGISTLLCDNYFGYETVNFYDRKAQKLILDHFEEIFSTKVISLEQDENYRNFSISGKKGKTK